MREQNRELGPWRERVALAASHVFDRHPDWRPAGPGEPLLMRLEFIRPRPKRHPKSYTKPCTSAPDLDKMIRAVGDALTNVVYADDSQIVELSRVVKRYAEIDEPPGVNIEVERLVFER
jgi:crossover junction endodeoxyribonuclease RusA